MINRVMDSFGFGGYLLFGLMTLSLIGAIINWIEFNKFYKDISIKLEESLFEAPDEISSFKWKFFIAIPIISVSIISLCWFWVEESYWTGLITSIILMGVGYGFIDGSDLLEKTHDIIIETNYFVSADDLLTVLDVKQEEKSDQDKKKIIMGSLAIFEALGLIRVYELDNKIYFSKPDYIEEISNKINNIVNAEPNQRISVFGISKKIEKELSGVNIGILKLSKNINEKLGKLKGKSPLSLAAIQEFVINYSEYTASLTNNGNIFIVNSNSEQLQQKCSCCDQLVDETDACEYEGELFCSDECKNVYQKALTEKFVPEPAFLEASSVIDRGVDALIITNAIGQFVDNKKIFAIGGQGHGFAAEQANNMIDKLKGKDATVIGGDNKKWGADRLVNGQEIQTKYFKTASRSVGAMFDGQDGMYKYIDKNGNAMPTEVPLDQYEKAVESMRTKITEGRVPGVSNPEQAKDLVVKGSVTYDQAKNITKFGTVEGLMFDAGEGAVLSLYAGSASLVLNFSQQYWIHKDPKKAIQGSLVIASKAYGRSFVTMVLTQQLHRLPAIQSISIVVPKSMTGFLARGLNVKATQVNQALKGTMVSSAVIISVSASIDLYRVINNTITASQFVKNTTVTTGAVAGSVTGMIVGRALGATLGSIGGPVGSFIGGAILGTAGSKITKTVMDKFIEDDIIVRQRLIKYKLKTISEQFMLSNDEVGVLINYCVPKLNEIKPSRSGTKEISYFLLLHAIYLVRTRPAVNMDLYEDACRALIEA